MNHETCNSSVYSGNLLTTRPTRWPFIEPTRQSNSWRECLIYDGGKLCLIIKNNCSIIFPYMFIYVVMWWNFKDHKNFLSLIPLAICIPFFPPIYPIFPLTCHVVVVCPCYFIITPRDLIYCFIKARYFTPLFPCPECCDGSGFQALFSSLAVFPRSE